MLLFAGALALLATGVWMRRLPKVGRRSTLLAPASLVVVILLSFAPTGLVKPLDDGKVLDERESRYQFIQTVAEPDGRHILQLNEGWAVHSIWDPDTVLTGGIWDHFLVVPALRNRPDESRHETTMLVIGSAAGTTKRAFDALRPTVDMTSVELDTEVTKVGRKHFELTGDVEAFDGRPFLERSDDEWDVIHIDAYRQPYIPFYLTTREFFELAKAHLTDGGVVSINVGSSPDDPRINEAVAATMRDVFPIVARYRAENYNEVIVAVDDPGVTIDELRERIRASDVPDQDRGSLVPLFRAFADGMREVEPDPDRVLTDDRAPVEWMTDRMIFGEAD
jgi:spermidine synthase